MSGFGLGKGTPMKSQLHYLPQAVCALNLPKCSLHVWDGKSDQRKVEIPWYFIFAIILNNGLKQRPFR